MTPIKYRSYVYLNFGQKIEKISSVYLYSEYYSNKAYILAETEVAMTSAFSSHVKDKNRIFWLDKKFSSLEKSWYFIGVSIINIFIFFSARERARWTKSCNLIGSGSGRNFPILTAVNGKGRGELATGIEIWENKGVSFSYIASCDFWVLTE